MKKNTPYISERIIVSLVIYFLIITIFSIVLLLIHATRILGMIFIIIIVAYSIWVYKYIYQPYVIIKKTLELVINGYTLQDIKTLKYNLTPENESVITRLIDMVTDQEMINATKKQAEFLALQNQINPHFLYNTLESIRSEALISGVDSVADVTEKLATFYRYTISKIERSVTINEELNHINDYMAIQKFRFGSKLNLCVLIDEKDYHYIIHKEIPKLILQPIVENAVFHGIERKIGKGTITIRFELTEQSIIITISDDGVGMTYEALSVLKNKLRENSSQYLKSNQKEGGIALINVNNRIKLIFGENYGLNVYSTLNVGTDVEIVLPFEVDLK